MNWCGLMILLTLNFSLLAAETNGAATAGADQSATNGSKAVPRNDFEAFRVIAQRNIFNPNRSGRGSRNENGEAARAVKTESVGFVGTMLYEKGEFAFFDSSSSNYKKVAKAGDSIAGFKVLEVAPGRVKLENNGKTLELAVGQALNRQDEGEWTVGGKAASETSSGSGTSEGASSTSTSADEDETLKRLMKKRQEELEK